MKLAWFVVVALILTMGTAVVAQDITSEQKLMVSPHYFYLMDGDARDVLGGGIGLTVAYRIGEDIESPLYVSLGYTALSGSMSGWDGETYVSADLDVNFMPLMVTKYFYPQTESPNKFFYGVGAGIVRSKADLGYSDYWGSESYSGSETDFAWQLLAGMNFNQKAFGELKYFNGSDDLNTGLMLSIGARF